jgi:GWxTD domain-containing protein
MSANHPPAANRGPEARAGALLLLLLLLAASASCRLERLERRLNPKYSDFYSKVQYIMTREERKIFLELPDSERDPFIEEFWKRRNPDPDSETNAFQAEYENRVKRADELFRSEGRPGHRTDRGRIYILFGPPMERLTYPMDAEGYCREIWYYGGFPVIFVDEHCEGQFLLTAINLEHLQMLNIAQGHFQQTFEQDKKFFDYNLAFMKMKSGPEVLVGQIVIDVPFGGIWFSFKEGLLSTALEVRAEAGEASGARVWGFEKSYPLAFAEDELVARRGKSYRVEIPFALGNEAGHLRGRTLVLRVSVKNSAEGEDLKKVLEIRLER